MTAPLLSVRGLSKRFGGLVAVDGVDFDVHAGQILGVIGPNGAGKTTTFNMIAGALRADAGSIQLAGNELVGRPPHAIAAAGVLRTFQHNRLFDGMTLTENVLVGAHARLDGHLWSALFGLPRSRAGESAARRKAAELLAFAGLDLPHDAEVGALSFGQGRLLEIARALAGDPRLILLDEPAAGLTPVEMARIGELIRAISGRGIAVLVIDHDMKFLLPLAARVVVLNFGRRIGEGTPDEIRADPAVREAYLGETAGVGA